MVSAVGSGSVLFTPRVAARYEYALLWVALLTCGFMWVMIREAARYTTVTGKTLLDGFNRLPGPRGWALWVIFLPQLFAAVVGVAGLCALVGSAAQVAGGGSHAFYTLAMIGLSTALVAWGEYGAVERLCRYMAILLILLSGAAAAQVFPGPAVLAAGLTPDLPEAFDEGWNGEAPGPDYALPLARAYFNMRKASIYGGSNEIQRNIVAKHLLGF